MSNQGPSLAASEARVAELEAALTSETAICERALDDACSLATSVGSLSPTLPWKENKYRMGGVLPFARKVFEWTYHERRKRAAAKDPDHPDNDALATKGA